MFNRSCAESSRLKLKGVGFDSCGIWWRRFKYQQVIFPFCYWEASKRILSAREKTMKKKACSSACIYDSQRLKTLKFENFIFDNFFSTRYYKVRSTEKWLRITNLSFKLNTDKLSTWPSPRSKPFVLFSYARFFGRVIRCFASVSFLCRLWKKYIRGKY